MLSLIIFFVVNCVDGSKIKTFSILSKSKTTRTGRLKYMGKISNMSPLQAKSFGSATVSVFLNPQEYSLLITSSLSMVSPGPTDIDDSPEDAPIVTFFSFSDAWAATHT